MVSGKEVAMKRTEDRLCCLTTQSGFEVKDAYGPQDIAHIDYETDTGEVGEYPYIRGIYKGMYRNLLWLKQVTISPETEAKCNERFKMLIEGGATSLRIGCDEVTVAGIDPDHPMARRDICRTAVTTYALRCMERMLEGISLTGGHFEWNNVASRADAARYAMFLALARRRGVDFRELRGELVNDPIHVHAFEFYTAQPFELDWKLAVDAVEYSVKHTPKWNPSCPCGYDIRECGVDTIQELALVIAERLAMIDAVMARGASFEEVSTQMPFSLNGQMDFFENVCKLRALRRIWARIAKERYGATAPKAMKARCSIRSGGTAMTAQQPMNNISRLTTIALAAVMGGAQSIELAGFDEALCLPSPDAHAINLGINHILAHETGVPLVADPLGGSYYVEWLTGKIEEQVLQLLAEIEKMGGIIEAFKKGWVRDLFHRENLRREEEISQRERLVVGVNAFSIPDEEEVPIRTYILKDIEEEQEQVLAECRSLKEGRNIERTKAALGKVYAATRDDKNVIESMMNAYDVDATIGEVTGVIRLAMGYNYDPFDMIEAPTFIKEIDQDQE